MDYFGQEILYLQFFCQNNRYHFLRYNIPKINDLLKVNAFVEAVEWKISRYLQVLDKKFVFEQVIFSGHYESSEEFLWDCSEL